MKKLVAICLGLAVLTQPVSGAEISIKDWKHGKAMGGDYMNIILSYLSGIGDGYSYAVTDETRKGFPPLFCPPDNLALNQGNLRQMLEKAITHFEARGMKDDMPIAPLLLWGMQDAFPCKKP